MARGGLTPGSTRATSDSSADQLSEFVRFCQTRTGRSFADHTEFHDFSVAESERFWLLLLEFSRLIHHGSPEPVRTSKRCELAEFFPHVKLSYCENLLDANRPWDDDRGALIAHHAFGEPDRLTIAELRSRVVRVSEYLRTLEVGSGDRVVAVASNNAEVIIVALAAASIGAAFSCASPEMGVPALLSRFAQLNPSVLAANLVVVGATGPREVGETIRELVAGLPDLKALIALDDGPAGQVGIPTARLSELLSSPAAAEAVPWRRFAFNHPLFVLFSSGTTGPPKCIVHGAGGTLLEHVKEHRLHVDLHPGDRLFFHTSAAWMMWNWQLSALASGAEVVLYDGPVTGPQTLWDLVAKERVNVFGTSPPYLQLCEDAGFQPGELPELRTILSTGSILHDWQYDWVEEHVGQVALQSISGGTDIIGCFVLGAPGLPVRRGMIQCRSLGLDVQSLDGELVCRNPFPSRPIGFVGDDGTRFHQAYFEQNPGVWTHGDLIEFEPDGQARLLGRSDGVLNVHGERIGPAEIRRALRGLREIDETMAVELWGSGGEPEILLLVVLHPPAVLDARLIVRIRRAVAENASAFHVPAFVAQVDQLPVTHSGKRSERAARDAANGREVANAQALANPDSLEKVRAAALNARARREALERAAPSPNSSTKVRVLAIWEATLGIALRPDDNFFELGGTSLTAVRLLQAIHEQLGLELPPSSLITAQTPAKMAELIDAPPEQYVPILVPLRAGTAEHPLFLVHSNGGDVLQLLPLTLALDTDRPVYGIQARGLDPLQTPQTSVEEMAATYLDAIRSVQPHGPYSLAGYSFGGLVAYEMAGRLRADGEQVALLAMIDTELHHDCLPAPARWRFLFVERPLRYLRAALAEPSTKIPHYLRKAIRRPSPQLPPGPARHEQQLPPRLAQLALIGQAASQAYRPDPYPGDVKLFLADTRFPNICNPARVWPRYVRGRLDVEPIGGSHTELVSETNVGPLAKKLSASL